jgi:hypothetical protein
MERKTTPVVKTYTRRTSRIIEQDPPKNNRQEEERQNRRRKRKKGPSKLCIVNGKPKEEKT